MRAVGRGQEATAIIDTIGELERTTDVARLARLG
jgi:hypothetical protein